MCEIFLVVLSLVIFQVGIMAFNVLGDPLKSPHRSLHHLRGDVLSDYLNESSSKPDYISPIDDLAFDMYQVGN